MSDTPDLAVRAVVLCKNCKYFKKQEFFGAPYTTCTLLEHYGTDEPIFPDENDYCSMGELKNE